MADTIVTNQYHTLKVFLNDGMCPNSRNAQAHTMLSLAISLERDDMVQLLLSYGANPSLPEPTRSGSFITSLHQAITAMPRYGDAGKLTKIVEHLFNSGAKIDSLGTFSAMCHTALPIDMLDLAFANGSDFASLVGENGHTTVLHAAIRARNVKYVYYILRRFPEILSCTDHWKMTALHLALVFGYEQLAKDLITCGIKVGIMDSAFKTELWYAISMGYTEVIEILLSKPSVDVNAAQSGCLNAAYEKKDFRVLVMLIQHPDIYIDDDMYGKLVGLTKTDPSALQVLQALWVKFPNGDAVDMF